VLSRFSPSPPHQPDNHGHDDEDRASSGKYKSSWKGYDAASGPEMIWAHGDDREDHEAEG
jgi:hypothetical protein